MSDKIIHLNDVSFEEKILQTKGLMLIDFWAEWCGPCKVVSKVFSEIADEFDKKITFCKLNIDENPVASAKYAIRSIPTFLLFRSGKIIETKTGVLTKRQLKEFLDVNL